MAAIALAMPTLVQAQAMPPVPADTAVIVGKLPNGLTYYIRQNNYPKGEADFYIAQKVGSILEEDHQRGLAHFLEHMCFNGTKNFPGNQVVSWLESIGVKFGANLNAYTGVDQTVYNISHVPTARESVQDSCLLILHDWANELLLDPEEIDKERGVIHQEWRRSNVGQMRILEQLLPTMYPDSRYGYRLPIGTMEVVDNFPYQALRDYYEAWYRPDQQGIVVVGDIDPARIEAKIKEMFSDIEMPANAPERVYYPVADNKGTIYAIGSDKEMAQSIVQIMFKFDSMPDEMKGSMAYLIYDYMTTLLNDMLNQRFQEMMSKPDTPFAVAQSTVGNFFLAKTKDSFTVLGLAKGNDILPTTEAIYREVLRAKRGGFTASEYDRARNEYLSHLEKAYNNRTSRETGSYVQDYINNFVDNEPMPSMEWLYPQMKQFAQMINVNQINGMLNELVTDDNRVVLVMMPDKEGYKLPTESELASAMKAVDAEEIEVFVDNVKEEPLIPALPQPGKVVKETANAMWNATEWTLSNGIKVIIKPTRFKEDEIMVHAVANGGLSTVINSMSVPSYQGLSLVLNSYGIGTYTESDLQKYLSGKQAGLRVSMDLYERTVSGTTTPKDIASQFELLYGLFTAINMTETEFKATQELYAGILQNQEANPQFIFQRDYLKSMYKSPYFQAMTAEDVRKANRDEILNAIHGQLANAADYTFVIVGNVDLNTLKPLVEQYVATLPANAKTATKRINKADASLTRISGSGMDEYSVKMETPQTYVAITESATMPYTAKDAKLASIAGQIMSARFIETIREKEGAVYSISAQGAVSSPEGMNAAIATNFPMKPEMKDKVLGIIKDEFKAMESNITDTELSKVKEYLVKTYTANKERNAAWLGAIDNYLTTGVDAFNGNIEMVNAITIADVQDFMKRMNAQNNYRIVVLNPAE